MEASRGKIITFANPNGDLIDGVRNYSEIYKYRMLDFNKIQFYFDQRDREKN